jgi:hypothetical protein
MLYYICLLFFGLGNLSSIINIDIEEDYLYKITSIKGEKEDIQNVFFLLGKENMPVEGIVVKYDNQMNIAYMMKDTLLLAYYKVEEGNEKNTYSIDNYLIPRELFSYKDPKQHSYTAVVEYKQERSVVNITIVNSKVLKSNNNMLSGPVYITLEQVNTKE